MSSNEMVPSRPVGEPMALDPIEPDAPRYLLDIGAPAFWTNINFKTDAGKALVLKCHNESDASGNDMIGKSWQTVHLLSHPVEITNGITGEVSDCVRTILVSPDGRTLSFVSEGILRSLRILVMMYGRGPWDPPLNLEIRQINLKDGKRTYSLQVADAVSKQQKGNK